LTHVRHHIGLTRVVSTVDSAVLGAGSTVRASSGVPRVAVVAVGVAAGDVGPAPVGVKDNRTRLCRAASATGTSACLPGQLGVSLRGHRASLLGAGGSEERERSEGERPVHGCYCEENCCRMRKPSDGRADVLYRSVTAKKAPLFGTKPLYPYDLKL
jgi:hypothetical protein